MIQMVQTSVQFGGLPNEDPNLHIVNFLELRATFKFNGVSDDAIRLRLFPFSLWDRAKNAATCGAFVSKGADEAYELLEELDMNNYQWPAERDTSQRKVARVHELDAITALTAQVASLTKQLQQNMISAQAQAI
ncbi:uncharacterized protein LOC133781409 [Humulus lupulus]|uniref:uncharacterized protein LOC133781409 n=1 Tax=Humulus lupulus TaxID=3486 RepID=UPI002B413A6A|nr:uncharacterized protein LOC133781409 [Humulus lupulus]